MKYDRYFLLSWRRLLWIIAAWTTAVILHNAIYAWFSSYFARVNGDEAVFFIIATIIIPLYVIISLVYTLIRYLMKRNGKL